MRNYSAEKRKPSLKAIAFFCALLTFPCYQTAADPRSQIQEKSAAALKAQQEGRFGQAIELFRQCLGQAARSKDVRNELEAQFSLGILYWDVGELKLSREQFVAASSLADRSTDESAASRARSAVKIIDLYLQGKSLFAAGKHEEAIKSYDQAVALSRVVNVSDFELKCSRLASLAYWELNDYGTFYALNRKNLDLAVKLRHTKEEVRALNNLGAYFIKMGSFATALGYLEKARSEAKANNMLTDLADLSLNIGTILADLGNFDGSVNYLNEALGIFTSLGDNGSVAETMNNIGHTLRLKAVTEGDTEAFLEAKKYFEQALRTARELKNDYLQMASYINIGIIYSHLNLYDKAFEYQLQAEKLATSKNRVYQLGKIYNNMGIIQAKLGDDRKSVQYFDKALELASRFPSGSFVWETFLELGNKNRALGKDEESIKYYKDSIALIEDTRSKIVIEDLKASYFGADRRMEAYQNLIDLLVTLDLARPGQGYAEEAYHYLERAKARAFLDSLEVSEVDITQGIDPKLLFREKHLTREISRAYTSLLTADISEDDRRLTMERVKELEEQLSALKNEIRLSSPAYADLKYPAVMTFAEVKKQVGGKESAYLAYSLGEKSSLAFLITAGGLRVARLPGRNDIRAKVIAYRRILSDPQTTDFKLGEELFRVLVPMKIDPAVRKIIIIPDDILNILPFEALAVSTEPLRWLAEDYAVSYAPSVTSLAALQKRRSSGRRPGRSILAVGDPVYQSFVKNGSGDSPLEINPEFGPWAAAGFERLRFSGYEAAGAASLFKSGKAQVLLGEKATEDAFKAAPLSDYRIIHLATHAFVDDRNPLRSSVVLTLDRDPNEDGLLQMREIFNLKLNADLVTLSACQTGLGQFIKGEGISGINRAFFYAGASSVCISLWAVNDEATYQLMNRFYLHIRSGMTVKEALRTTKLEMIRSGVLSHPYYWAPFIVSGKSDIRVYSRTSLPALWLAVPLLIGLAAAATARTKINSRRKKHSR